MPTRSEIVAEARTWLNTPYKHQGSVKGAGTDCIGLIRGIWRKFYGDEPEGMPGYTRDWAENAGEEALLGAADRYMVRFDHQGLRLGAPFDDGDLVLFRMVDRGPAKHAGITVAPFQMIHSYSGARVHLSHVPTEWRLRIGAAYSFPGVVRG